MTLLTNKDTDGHSEQFNKKIVFSVPAKWRFPLSVPATRKNDREIEAKNKRNFLKIRKKMIYSDFTYSRTNKVSILSLFLYFYFDQLK